MKTTVLVVAALSAAIFSSSAADASVRYRHSTLYAGAGRHLVAYRHAGPRSGFRLSHQVGLRGARPTGRTWAARATGTRSAYGRQGHGIRSAQHYAVRGHGYGHIGQRDAMIRRYVGPRTAYAPATATMGSTSVSYGTQTGAASYYSGGRNHTANGGLVGAATCAHRSLPFGTRVLVTNLANAHRMVLTVNDRGPFVGGRIIDVSTTAAASLGMLHSGTAPVSVQVVGGHG